MTCEASKLQYNEGKHVKVSEVEERGAHGEMPNKRFETPKPVSVGDVVDVTIESVGGQGDGIAKVSGFVVFVKGAKKDERVRVKITDVKRTYAVAEKVGAASREEEPAESMEPEESEEESEEGQ